MFETETMAELCVRQGLLDKAAEIYRRLVAEAPDEITGARRRQRLHELERQGAGAKAAKAVKQPAEKQAADQTAAPAAVKAPAVTASSAVKRFASAPAPSPAAPAGALPLPGVHATWDRRHTVVQWRLPADVAAPALELLLVLRTPAGILTERRTLRLDNAEGRMALPVPDLFSVRAAAGRMEGDRFVPIVRVGQ